MDKRARKGIAVGATALLGLLATVPAQAGSIGSAAGFEDDDGNLVINTSGQMDWNGFAGASWTGTSPYQHSASTVNGWSFTGLQDAQKSSSDTGFGGGVKQDDNCPAVIGGSAPNKDDLKRAYVASKTVNGHVYLELAWVRIPQNTTSPSAHVGFEFNQSTTGCPSGSDGLVQRTPGDLLVVYDFEGSSTSNPTLTIRRWVTSGSCDVGSDSPPCWGVAQNVTSSGFGEARVNTTTSVNDAVAPGGDTLGLNEFGEAGIDLTAAGAFGSGGCTHFGKLDAVSRSSGNSGSAAMEDLVGPGNVSIDNCRPAAITSGQKVVISDTAKVTGFGTPTGTVDFKLFTNSSCSGTPLYDSGAVTLASGIAHTANATTQPPTLKNNGTYYWLVTYSGDANNLSSTSACGTEQTTISGSTPALVP
jgi:hypothetical protein